MNYAEGYVGAGKGGKGARRCKNESCWGEERQERDERGTEGKGRRQQGQGIHGASGESGGDGGARVGFEGKAFRSTPLQLSPEEVN